MFTLLQAIACIVSQRYLLLLIFTAFALLGIMPACCIVQQHSDTSLSCLVVDAAARGRPCMRCSNGIPHSKHASFFKFVDVLVAEANITKISKPCLDEMEGESAAA